MRTQIFGVVIRMHDYVRGIRGLAFPSNSKTCSNNYCQRG